MGKFQINDSLKIKNFDFHQKSIQKAIRTYVKSSDKDLQKLLDMSLGAGKNMRSSMLLVVASASESDPRVISACAAVEILHLASLVHDDDLDRSPTRRGEPTVYATAGHKKTLIVGDYLFACAHQAAAEAGQEIATIMAEACKDLCRGQYLEERDGYNQERTLEDYRTTIEGKTCSLIIASLKAGAFFGDEQDEKALQDYGRYFGLAFQQLDDVLDLLSTKEQLGKPVHQDVGQGTYTAPVLHVMSTAAGADAISPYLQTAKNLQFDGNKLVDDIHANNGFEASFKEIRNNIKLAQKSISNTDGVKGLGNLADDYYKWALKNQVARQHVDKVNNRYQATVAPL